MDHDPEPVIPDSGIIYGPYRTLGPFTESEYELEDLIQETHPPWFKRVCQDPNNYRWIIEELSSGSDSYYALGPFVFNQHRTVTDSSWVSCIRLEHGQFVETNGFGVVCVDRNMRGIFWVVCMPSGCIPEVPADPRTLITTLTKTATDCGFGQAHDEYPSGILEGSVEGEPDPSGMERYQTDDYTQPWNVDTTGGDGAGAEAGGIQYMLLSTVGEGSAGGAAGGVAGGDGVDGEVATIPGIGCEWGQPSAQADEYPSVILDELADGGREGFSMEKFEANDYTQPWNVDTEGRDGADGEAGGFQNMLFSTVGEGYAGGADNGDEIHDLHPGDGGYGAALVDEIFDVPPWDGAGGAAYEDEMFDLQPGDGAGGAAYGDEFPYLHPVDEFPYLHPGDGGGGVASFDEMFDLQPGDGGGEVANGDEILNLQLGDGGGEAADGDEIQDLQLGDGGGGAANGDEIQDLQPDDGGGGAANGDENLNLQPGRGGADENLNLQLDNGGGGADNGDENLNLQPGDGGEQGLSTEDQNVEDQGQPALTKSWKKKAKRPRELKMKNHGVKKRQGGIRTTFVAYFRPSDLPQSDKRFVTVGEFESEDEAWYAFNLFSTVHERVSSYTEIKSEEIKMNLDVEASMWSQFPRLDLLAHLRLDGRGKMNGVPRYRNVKTRSKGRNVVWSCDVILPKDISEAFKGMKKTFDSGKDAAKAADELMYLKEGIMAWTNFPFTNLNYDEIKNLPKDWIPLQENPKKYLTNDK